MLNIKSIRHNLADKLELWGKSHGIYAVPMISTVNIKRELLRKPWLSNQEDHIRKVIRQFYPTQPASINLILESIETTHYEIFVIANSELDRIKNEHI